MVKLKLFFYVCWALFPGNAGIDIKVSDQVAFHQVGENLTIYCTDESTDEIVWFKGKDHLTDCSIKRGSCIPADEKYTVDPKNRRFNLNLYNVSYSDCGTYRCIRSRVDEQSYKLELIERVNNILEQEVNGTLSITTNCVLPTSAVDIQWYYTYKDGPPRIYGKSATRIEERGRCQGECGGNHAMTISSLLTPRVDENNGSPVKFMAYVWQGDSVQKVTFSNEYRIKGCAGPSIAHIWVLIVLAIICIVCNVVVYILYRRDFQQRKNMLPYVNAIWICLVILICFGIQLAYGKEPTVPDIFGACHDNYSAEPIEFGCILIVVGLIVGTVCPPIFKRKSTAENGKVMNKRSGTASKGIEVEEVELPLVSKSPKRNDANKEKKQTQKGKQQQEQDSDGVLTSAAC